MAGSKETLAALRVYAHRLTYTRARCIGRDRRNFQSAGVGTSQPHENADYFHAQLRRQFDTGASTTYVMPIVIGDRERMYRLGRSLRRRGLWACPWTIRLSQNRICFRACVTAKHTRASGRSVTSRTLSVVAAKAKRLMMSQQVETRHCQIAATYKAREVEGAVDSLLSAPLG